MDRVDHARLYGLVERGGRCRSLPHDRGYCVVFFAQIVPNTDAATDAVITTQNAAFVTQIGLRSDAALISIVDQNAAIKANAAWATQWMSDTTHPNYRGYNVMAAAWRTALTTAGY